MKIVIIGGTGRIGARITDILEQQGHHVIAASRSTGVNTISGEGLNEALSQAQVVVDVSNAPAANETEVQEVIQGLDRSTWKHGIANSSGDKFPLLLLLY